MGQAGYISQLVWLNHGYVVEFTHFERNSVDYGYPALVSGSIDSSAMN